MSAYGLHWLPTNNVYFDPPSNTVDLEEFGSCFDMRRDCFLRCQNNSTLHAQPKDEH